MDLFQPHILIADDDPDTIELLDFKLRGADYRVDSTDDGQKALFEIRQNGYHGAVLDHNFMQPPNGASVALDARAARPELVIVLNSSESAEGEELRRLQESGVYFSHKDADRVVVYFNGQFALARAGILSGERVLLRNINEDEGLVATYQKRLPEEGAHYFHLSNGMGISIVPDDYFTVEDRTIIYRGSRLFPAVL
ncbi:MAG: response regulator [Candidatus Aenigmarchaeota archaeon]|nr:response regulator [Candidatus Aenigmarchaeota archaeon]